MGKLGLGACTFPTIKCSYFSFSVNVKISFINIIHISVSEANLKQTYCTYTYTYLGLEYFTLLKSVQCFIFHTEFMCVYFEKLTEENVFVP